MVNARMRAAIKAAAVNSQNSRHYPHPVPAFVDIAKSKGESGAIKKKANNTHQWFRCQIEELWAENSRSEES